MSRRRKIMLLMAGFVVVTAVVFVCFFVPPSFGRLERSFYNNQEQFIIVRDFLVGQGYGSIRLSRDGVRDNRMGVGSAMLSDHWITSIDDEKCKRRYFFL
ncbi:MAG: hypothetical protein FWC93_02265 [Defluviitaleaceae bacterium]|nr:hypothetical protein [Defluviitaleaceae bacterium]